MNQLYSALQDRCRRGFALLLVGTLAACGGGGGGGGGGGTTPPPPATYTVGGTVSGLTGSGLVLQVNGGDNLTVAANATSFVFSTAIASGSAYAVTVSTQPSGENCSVTSGSGTVGSANVTSVAIACTAAVAGKFTIGGTITGLTASGLKLEDNGGDSLTVAANAKTFAFVTPIATGAAYAVTVATQPTGETCAVTNGSGTVGTADITTVSIVCTPVTVTKYTVGGMISGLTSSGLVLSDNVGDHLTIAAGKTSFTLPTSFAAGSTYMVAVATQPSNPAQVCTVTNGSGTVGTANVTTVSVSCLAPTYKIGGTISGLTSSGLVLQDNAGDNLTVLANATTFTFATSLASGKPYAATVLTQPASPAEVCTVTNGTGTVANAPVTSISVSCVKVGQFVYVANSIDGATGNGDISAYAINQTPGSNYGTLTAVTGSPFLLGMTDMYPTAVAVDPNGHAYVANRHSSNVAFFDIGSNGALTLHSDVGGQGTSGTSIAVSVGNPSTYVYVGGYSTSTPNGSVSGWLDDPASGDLSASPNVPYPAETVLNGIAVDPAQQFVFTTSSSHDWVIAYTIGTGGALTELQNSPFSTSPGGNLGSPYGVVTWPLGTAAGGFVYTTNPSTNTVTGFSYDNTGNLTILSTSPFTTGGTQPEGIAMDPTGKYLYVTNYVDGNVTSFSVDASSGALTQIGSPVNTGNLNAVPNPGPIDVKVDPSGQFVYVVNYLDASVSLFRANAGVLTLSGTYPAGTEATSVAIE
jgi:6-phosphogluconolactonase (cycloisomerase 2 family)